MDYVISCHKYEVDVACVIAITHDLFMDLMEKYKNEKVRLIAKVNYDHIVLEEIRSYHFASYASEIVHDPKEFFERHMLKISQRMDEFNHHGSNLLIRNISHIHIQISCKNPTV